MEFYQVRKISTYALNIQVLVCITVKKVSEFGLFPGPDRRGGGGGGGGPPPPPPPPPFGLNSEIYMMHPEVVTGGVL